MPPDALLFPHKQGHMFSPALVCVCVCVCLWPR